MLRCEIFCLCAFVVALAAPLKATQVCTSSQYKKILPSGGYKCNDCPRCPVAYGNLKKCGTTIPYDAKVQCEHCPLGTSYSTENDHTQCLPCKVCAPDVISTPCTRESNTVCHDKCKSKENYYDKRSRDCQKCSWCCHDGNDELQQECLNSGMPPNHSCAVRQGKKCGPVSGKTTSHVVSPFTTTTKTSTTDKPTGNPDNTPSLLLIISVVCGTVAIGILLGAIIFVIVKRRRRQKIIESESASHDQTLSRNHGKQLPKATSYDNQVIIGTNHRLFDWFEKNSDIRRIICFMLDDKNSYVEMARYFQMEDYEVKWLIHKDRANDNCSPTEKLLEALETCKKSSLLVLEFMQCLDHIKRRDVADFLKSKLKATTSNNAEQV